MPRPTKHDRALAELEELHQAGRIDEVRYQTHRRRLLAEARRMNHPVIRTGRRIMIVAVVIAALLMIGLLVWAVWSTITTWS